MADSLTTSSSTYPFSPNAEAACLGAILINNQLYDEVFSKLKVEDFYDGRNQIIAKTLTEFRLEKGDLPFDIITLNEELKRRDLLTKGGGISYINYLVDVVPTITNIKEYVEIVFEKSLLRKIINISGETIVEARQSFSSSDVLEKCQERFFSLSLEEYKDYEHIKVSLNTTIDIIERNYREKGSVGISSGYKELDRLIVGFQDSNLIIVGGRTGTGKTAFALNMIERMAFKVETGNKKVGIGIFSLEMSKTEICMRLLSNRASISLSQFKNASFKDSRWQSLIKTVDDVQKTNILIDDTPGIDIRELSSKARKMVKDGINILFVDYLQLITEREHLISREQQISFVSKQLKNLARNLNIPIIALTQLNRSVESREDKTPRLSDIRESGSIEQDADLVLFIHRETKKSKFQESNEEINLEVEENFFDKSFPTKIYVSKNRHGPTGNLSLTFEGEFLRFIE